MTLAPSPSLTHRLRRLIETSGPICVAEYMGLANQHYYASRDPFGAGGDFVTAPEISQMFGEMMGLCLADAWQRAGRPETAAYVELGPGRGTLAADALRAMGAAGLTPPVELVETSPLLRRVQAERLGQVRWHEDVTSLPEEGPLLVVANEFFDALPTRQFVATQSGWHERVVDWEDGRFVVRPGRPVPAFVIPEHLRGAPAGSVLEVSPTAAAIVRLLAHRLVRQGGMALIVDYGHPRTTAGETLQAVRGHAYAAPWADPGESDLTVHVDFEALGSAAVEEGVRVVGPVQQGAWLTLLGIGARTAALSVAAPERAQDMEAARARLVAPEQMGTLFKVMGLVAPGWPDPAGFG